MGIKSTKAASKYLSDLVQFGLSNNEAKVYIALLEKGSLTARDLAKIFNTSPNAQYRLLNNLVKKDLIIASSDHPATYRVISPTIAFDAFVKKQISNMEIDKEALIQGLTSKQTQEQTKIDLIGNIRDFFLAYSKLTHQAQSEILIISIGEDVPEEVLLANRDSLERGVKIRFIAHKYNSANKDLLDRWIKMGIEVRHYPDWGFHLVVIDKKISLLSINNPQNTSERVSLQFNSQGLSKALGDYFYATWEKASLIKKL